MAESDADLYYGVMASELRQLAWVAGEFRDALRAMKVPATIQHDMILAWFDTALEAATIEIDNDD